MPTVPTLPVHVLSRITPAMLPTLGLVVVGAIAVSLLAPGHPEVEPLAWGVVAVGATSFLGCTTELGRRLWMLYGTSASAVLVALLVATTGGPESAYQDLFVLLLVSAAVLKRVGPLVVDAVVIVLATLAPAVYGPTGAEYTTDLLIDLGTWLAVAVVARVLTAQLVAASTDLAESDQRFQLLAADVPAVVYRQSLVGDRRLTWLNAQALNILGFAPEEMLADPDLAVSRVPPEDRDGFLVARRDPVAGEAGVVRYRFDRADGRRIWLEDHYAPVTDASGEPVAVLGVAFDASAQVTAEQSRQDAQEYDRLARRELARVLQAQHGFIQAVSHELRTPLTTVAGFATLLAERGDQLPADQRRHLTARLVAGTHRLTALVNDLVDIDRLVGDPDSQVAPARHDVRALVEEAVRHVPTDDHEVVVEGNPGVGEVDPALLHRIVRHLVDNAVRHTPAGTTVRCVAEREDGGVRLTVEDDGPGVPDVLAHTLFDPFVQGPDAMQDPNPGTGIGLALTAHLARAHHGRAWHEPTSTGGARFVVQLGAASRADARG